MRGATRIPTGRNMNPFLLAQRPRFSLRGFASDNWSPGDSAPITFTFDLADMAKGSDASGALRWWSTKWGSATQGRDITSVVGTPGDSTIGIVGTDFSTRAPEGSAQSYRVTLGPKAGAGPLASSGLQEWRSLAQQMISALRDFRNQLSSGSIHPDTAIPTSLAVLALPPAGASEADTAKYEEYSDLKAAVNSARVLGRIRWEVDHPAPYTSPTAPGATTTTNTPSTPPISSYVNPQPYYGGGGDAYSPDAYPYSGGTLVIPGQAQATIVPISSPGSTLLKPASQQPASPARSRGGAIGAAILAAVAGLYLWKRRRGSK